MSNKHQALASRQVEQRSVPAYSQIFSIKTLIDILIADPDRFEKTAYVETGVPMILIGEDGSSDTLGEVDGQAVDKLGEHLAELAAVLSLRKPQLDYDDVGRLMEVLAERYFRMNHIEPLGAEAWRETAELLLPALAPEVLRELAVGLARSRAIRLVNFHATPRYREAEYRRQIAELAEAFEPITPANFADAVAGKWRHTRPGVMPALFEGYRDNFDVLLPILEEYGFTGWFFVPPAFLSVPPRHQRSYAAKNMLHLPERDEYIGDRIALTWDEARQIAQRGHAFACHTRTHYDLTPNTPRSVLEEEIVYAKAEMEAELGTRVDMFCWLGGAALGYNIDADAMLREAGYRYLFSNYKVQVL